MKKHILLTGCLLVALQAAAQSNYGVQFSSLLSDNLTLENAIRLGLENNSDFLSAKEEIKIPLFAAICLTGHCHVVRGGLPHGIAGARHQPLFTGYQLVRL